MKLDRPLLISLACLCWLLTPSASSGAGEAVSTRASAALDFRIIIPPIMRVITNDHPTQLATNTNGITDAEQRLVVMSNMRHGFCANLRLASPQVQSWHLSTADDTAITLQKVSDGYRLCTTRPGLYTLTLHHAFDTRPDHQQSTLNWPIQTNLLAL